MIKVIFDNGLPAMGGSVVAIHNNIKKDVEHTRNKLGNKHILILRIKGFTGPKEFDLSYLPNHEIRILVVKRAPDGSVDLEVMSEVSFNSCKHMREADGEPGLSHI